MVSCNTYSGKGKRGPDGRLRERTNLLRESNQKTGRESNFSIEPKRKIGAVDPGVAEGQPKRAQDLHRRGGEKEDVGSFIRKCIGMRKHLKRLREGRGKGKQRKR